jgi:enoyl-CoA hydratase
VNADAGLTTSVRDGVAWVRLDRPDKANALDQALWSAIGKAFEWIDAEDAIRVAVLGGNGRHFCAGIDFGLIGAILAGLNGLKPGRKEERLRRIILELQAAFTAIEHCRKPVLAAVQGLCLGGGLDLIATCDVRYAAADARFALKEVDLGIVADIGSLQRLPYLLGEGRVRELAFTGREFDAAEAFEMGLVNRVYATPAELLAGVEETARLIAAKSPLTVRGIKQVMNYSRDHSIVSGLEFVATWNAAMLLSEDTAEAVAAAMQKRTPRFED